MSSVYYRGWYLDEKVFHNCMNFQKNITKSCSVPWGSSVPFWSTHKLFCGALQFMYLNLVFLNEHIAKLSIIWQWYNFTGLSLCISKVCLCNDFYPPPTQSFIITRWHLCFMVASVDLSAEFGINALYRIFCINSLNYHTCIYVFVSLYHYY